MLALKIVQEAVPSKDNVWIFLASLQDACKVGPIPLRSLRIGLPHSCNLPPSCFFLGMLSALTGADLRQLELLNLDYNLALSCGASTVNPFRLFKCVHLKLTWLFDHRTSFKGSDFS
ncbi:hypothetical protein JCM10296v2_004754 [Rhodotorula toruloides]